MVNESTSNVNLHVPYFKMYFYNDSFVCAPGVRSDFIFAQSTYWVLTMMLVQSVYAKIVHVVHAVHYNIHHSNLTANFVTL